MKATTLESGEEGEREGSTDREETDQKAVAPHRDTTTERVARAYARIDELQRGEIRISLRPAHEALADASAVADRVAAGARLALAGLTLAVKDNIDVAGLPTTAACPRYSYAPRPRRLRRGPPARRGRGGAGHDQP